MTDNSGKSVIVSATLVARAHFVARRTLVNDSSCHLWTQSGPADFLATRLLGDNKVSHNSNVSPVPDIVLSQGDSFVSLSRCFYGRMMPSFYYFITFTTTHLPPTLPSFSLLLHIIALCTRQPVLKSEISDESGKKSSRAAL